VSAVIRRSAIYQWHRLAGSTTTGGDLSCRHLPRAAGLPQRQVFQDQLPMAAKPQRTTDHDQQLQHASIASWRRPEDRRRSVLARVPFLLGACDSYFGVNFSSLPLALSVST
jgi:hypothetical protein